MGRRRSGLAVVEAAYRAAPSDEAWLGGVLEAALPALDQGLGLFASTYQVVDGRPRFVAPIAAGCPPELQRNLSAINEALSPEAITKVYFDATCGTASQLLGAGSARQLLGVVPDAIGVNARDPSGFGCAMIAPLARVDRLDARRIALWSRIAAHLVTGMRLRQGRAPDEAVLDADGRVLHAERPAQTDGARHLLRSAARAIDRARSKTTDPEAAVALWRALVEGRWSLVDHHESDGRRLFIARKNDPTVRRLSALTLRERQVVAFAVLGHANKLIAYELGLSLSTVANHLASAATKLGVGSRAGLILVARTLGRSR